MNLINIKTSLISLLLLLTMFGFASCQKSEDIFDKSAPERVELKVQEFQKQLLSSKNGWILEYYTGRSESFGGFIIGLKFNDKGEVVACSDPFFEYDKQAKKLKPIKWSRSKYQIKADRSVTLNFTTFNDAIHFFSDTDQLYGKGRRYAFEGDYEFLLASSDNPDVINLEGKESHIKMRMIRATEPIEDYMNKVTDIKQSSYSYENMYRDHKDLIVGSISGKAVEISIDPTYNILNFSGKGLDDQEVSISFVYTPYGIRLERPILGIQELEWSAKENCFLAGQDKLIARDDPEYSAFAKFLGKYMLSYSVPNGNNGVQVAEPIEVEFVQAGRNVYAIKGLAYDIEAKFEPEHNRFAIYYQKINDGGELCPWNYPESTSLSFNPESGMFSVLKEGTDNTYVMLGNNAWGTKVYSFVAIKRTPKGLEIYPKSPARIVNPVFTKK